MKIQNLIQGLKEQLPLSRAFHNFFVTGNAWGLFHRRSHYRDTGVAKQGYPTRSSAERAADSMKKKHGVHFSVYKCIFCDVYHIGKNRTSIEEAKKV